MTRISKTSELFARGKSILDSTCQVAFYGIADVKILPGGILQGFLTVVLTGPTFWKPGG